MREIFDWVPWFAELSRTIAVKGEEFLAHKARQIPWKEGDSKIALLRYGNQNIDPFSFIYTLAGYQWARKRIYAAVNEAFGLTSELPLDRDEQFIFPTPQLTNVLFHSDGRGDPGLLWRLFRSTVAGIDQVSADDFDLALQIKQVAIIKLTQALFLVNPEDFLPYDDKTLSLGVVDASLGRGMRWDTYRNEIKKVREMFPGCMPYELNILAYESSKSVSRLRVNPDRCFQISTNVYNDNEDRWEDFSKNCWVYTGYEGSEKKPYPLTEPVAGDIILVRFAGKGHGIGVVYRNDYTEEFTEDARLHVLWISKKEAELSSGPRAPGFTRGDGSIGTAFREAYPEAFQILDHMSKRGNGPVTPVPPPHARPSPSTANRKGQHALNTILYGPPGTGKTYATTRRSVEICDGKALQDAAGLRARYGELLEDGRIEFVTFHQSYGYEEFVEGLRPGTAKVQGGGMRLRVEDGVLKRIAERARGVPNVGARRIFKMALGDPKSSDGTPHGNALFEECIDNGCVLLEYGGDIDWSDTRNRKEILERWCRERNPTADAYDRDVQAMRRFRFGMRPADIVVVSDGNERFRAVGEVTGDYEFHPREDGLHHRRPVRWCWQVHDREGDSVSVFKDGHFTHGPINRLKPANPAGLVRYLQSDAGGQQPYVLIIDEINRANISKVMGELITLLEGDKREGAVNEVTATLPYSSHRFTLPSNLHILATMNTADRSIALLDTALRRRFHFEELSPEPDLLTKAAERTGVDLPRVLRAINGRIEYLVDRDHVIGHAWFMNAKTRADVNAVMRHKIIPLIAEYFYDDWSKVRAVLGGTNDFVKRERLNAPPGLESDTGEARYRWIVQQAFAENAYGNLIGTATPATRDE